MVERIYKFGDFDIDSFRSKVDDLLKLATSKEALSEELRTFLAENELFCKSIRMWGCKHDDPEGVTREYTIDVSAEGVRIYLNEYDHGPEGFFLEAFERNPSIRCRRCGELRDWHDEFRHGADDCIYCEQEKKSKEAAQTTDYRGLS